MSILALPSPGKYDIPVSIRLEHEGTLLYTFDAIEGSFETWQTKTSLPLPERSYSAVINTGRNYQVVGGIGNVPLNLNDRYDKSTDTWICDTNLPMAVKTPATADAILSGGEGPATCAWDNQTRSWIAKCPSPKKISEHNLISTGNFIYSFNGKNNDVLRYDKRMDSWSYAFDNPFSAPYSTATGINGRGYFANEYGIMALNPDTKTVTNVLPKNVARGSAICCPHSGHFLLIGGHSDRILSDVSRINLNTRTIKTEPSAPLPGAYIASDSHANIAGLSRKNSFLEYICPLNMHEYSGSIFLGRNGKYTIHVFALDKDSKIIKQEILEYEINFRPMILKLEISSLYDTIIDWPNCVKPSGEVFTIEDIIPKEVTLSISENDGPIKYYNHEILEEHPTLNRNLVSGSLYRLRIRDPNIPKIGILIEANGPPKKS